MLYRVKQVIWAITSNFKKIDYNYINKYLDKNEILLFDKLKHSEKCHCIRVCEDCLRINLVNKLKIDKIVLGKVALLHDIGKGDYSLNLVVKSSLVVLHKITKGKLKNFSNFKSVDIYYNHGVKGRNILLKEQSKGGMNNKYSEEFLSAIENHHKYINLNSLDDLNNNILLRILIEADNMN